MPMIQPSIWTDDRIEVLKSLAGNGLSAAGIARELGVTRNAVIGKLTRLGVPLKASRGGRPKSANQQVAAQARGRLVFDREPPRKASHRDRLAQVAAFQTRFDAVEVVELQPEEIRSAVTLLELSSSTCRWPIGDPRDFSAMRFCGALPHEEMPYCARHCRMAYRAPNESERRLAKPPRSAANITRAAR